MKLCDKCWTFLFSLIYHWFSFIPAEVWWKQEQAIRLLHKWVVNGTIWKRNNICQGCDSGLRIERHLCKEERLTKPIDSARTKFWRGTSFLFAPLDSVILFVCLIDICFWDLWANWMSQIEGSGNRGTRATPYSFLNEPSGSFTCPAYSTDTWDISVFFTLFVVTQAWELNRRRMLYH